MNTKRTQLTKTKKLWDFPELEDGKKGRVFTKHYANMAFILPPNQFSFLSFLIYQSGADNTLKYSESLLKTYQQAVIKGTEHYGCENGHIRKSIPVLRELFIWLIENGFLFPTFTDKQFLINPNLTYSKLYVRAEFYKTWTGEYELVCFNGDFYGEQDKKLTALINSYLEHVNKNYKKRK